MPCDYYFYYKENNKRKNYTHVWEYILNAIFNFLRVKTKKQHLIHSGDFSPLKGRDHFDFISNEDLKYYTLIKRDSKTKRNINLLGSYLCSNGTNGDRILLILEMPSYIDIPCFSVNDP